MAALPPDYTANIISLVSTNDSQLLHVSLYTGRAEICRKFRFDLQTGQNHLYITGLPNVIEQESLRVQGHGNATIHDVSLSPTPAQPAMTTSPILQELTAKKGLLRNAIHRAQTSSRALETYMNSMSVHDVPLSQVGSFLESYNLHGSKLDEELIKLKKEEDELYEEIQAEKDRISAEQSRRSNGGTLGMQASISLFADNGGQVELELFYAVFSANWEATYDIRVSLESKEHPLTLVYKASIVQNTGEDWTNVPLTLETATPSYGVRIPTLNPLKLSTYRRRSQRAPPVTIVKAPSTPQPVILSAIHRSSSSSPDRFPSRRSRSLLSEDYRGRRRNDSSSSRSRSSRGVVVAPTSMPAPRVLDTLGFTVSSKGGGRFNHSVFQVPGLISVPCDNSAHKVTIVELTEELETKLLWFAVPKVDTRVYLSAEIKNTSEYALIPGKASVYVDGTFIARTNVPASGPDVTFDCSLGLDSSIKITYHPLATRITHRTPFTGFTGINSLSTLGTTKTTTTLYSQRITVVNTKRVVIDALKILDRIPVSEDERIKVIVLKPAELGHRLGMVLNEKKSRSQSQSHDQTRSDVVPVTETPIVKGSFPKKLDDASSLTSSQTMGKRFSSIGKKMPFSRKSQDVIPSLSKSALRSSAGEKAVSIPDPSVAQTSANNLPSPVTRIVVQWDGADVNREQFHSSPNETANHSDDSNFVNATADSSNPPVVVGPGMKKADKVGTDADTAGVGAGSELVNDGKMNWLLYNIAPQGTINLRLEWEVSAASNLEVVEWDA